MRMRTRLWLASIGLLMLPVLAAPATGRGAGFPGRNGSNSCGRSREVLRAECQAALGRELLFLSWCEEAEGWSTARLARGDSKGGESGQPWCRESRRKACSSVRSITRGRRCPPPENCPPRKSRRSPAGLRRAPHGPCVIVQPMPRSSRPVPFGGHRGRKIGHWSLQPVRERKPPRLSASEDVAWSAWALNPIDCFILKGLRDQGLVRARSEQGDADSPTTFDLTGLARVQRK